MSDQIKQPQSPGNPGSEVCQLLRTLLLVALLLLGNATTDGGPRFGRQTAAGTTVQTEGAKEIGVLEVGKPVTRELGGGEADSYHITLAPADYLRVVVDHRRIPIVVTLVGPDSRKLIENGGAVLDPIEWLCESAGAYRLVVRSRDKSASAVRYQVKIAELRAATSQESSRIAGQRAFKAAEQLDGQGTAQSRKEAIARFEEALSLSQTARDGTGQARALRGIGGVYNSLGENSKALEYYSRALPLFQQEQHQQGEAITLNNIGGSLLESNDNKKALEYFDQALALFKSLEDREREAIALSNLGRAYRGLSDRQKALDCYTQALDIHRTMNDRRGEAIATNNIGALYETMGEKEKALIFYNQSLSIRQELGDRRGVAVALNNIGLLHHSIGESRKALEYHEKALPLRREVGDQGGEAVTLNNIGSVYKSLGEKQKALDYLNQSLVLRRTLRDLRGEAVTLNQIGGVYNDVGEYQKALDSYNESLPLRRAIGDKSGEATTLNGLGALYDSLGDEQKALDHYERALALSKSGNDIRGQAVVLNNIGKIFRSMGNYDKALDYYIQSLTLREATRDRRGQSTTLSNIGMVYNRLGNRTKALEYYLKALQISRDVVDRGGEGITLDNIGSVYVALRDHEKAFDYFSKALTLRREVGDRQGEATTLTNLARVERDRGNFIPARNHTEAALRLLESLRAGVAGQELRASYYASLQGTFSFYIDLLMRLDKQNPSEGHVAAALQASEQARARSLLESLTEAVAGIRQAVDLGLLDRERSLQGQLSVKADSQMRLLNGNPTAEQAAEIRREIEALTIQYQDVEASMRTRSPRYAALTQPQPAGLKEIQQQLDPDTLLLEYSLGVDRSFLWAVSTSSVSSYELPNRVEIEAAAKRVYALLTARQLATAESEEQQRARIAKADADYPGAARQLSEMLLAPVASHLGTKRLVIVADGALQYVPFAVLPSPAAPGHRGAAGNDQGDRNHGRNDGTPLMVDHETISLPSASVIAVLRRETSGRRTALKSVAVLADPVFDKNDDRVAASSASAGNQVAVAGGGDLQRAARDAGLTGTGLGIPRLPFSREEAEAILAVAPAGSAMNATGFKANRATATSVELGQYRIVHFATHALLDSEHPELSGIVLSLVDEQGHPQDGFLRLHDLYNLNLSAELVVLSACQTALGKEIKGEGLIGLTRGFMYAGAPRVVASLWKVSDRATAQLMSHFYRGLLKGMRPAAALRAAQVAMLKDKHWQAPYYWAPFVLQGEWR